MSQEAVMQVIEKAENDAEYKKLLFSNPDTALKGYDLTKEEKDALSNLNEDNFDEFAGGLGDRSTKGAWTFGSG